MIIKITQEEFDELYLRQHLSTREIAKIYKVSIATFLRHLKRNNVEYITKSGNISNYKCCCKECGKEFISHSPSSMFCSDICSKHYCKFSIFIM